MVLQFAAPSYPFIILSNLYKSANDEFVKMYLEGRIKFNEISSRLLNFIKDKKFYKYKKKQPQNITEIIKLNNYVRLKLNSKVV